MKRKTLKKKIQRLEKRLREGPKKLARLRQKLQAAESAKAMKAARKSAARAARQAAKSKKSVPAKKAKRKLNLSPERRAQLSAAMKARWAAKKLLRRMRKPLQVIINIIRRDRPRSHQKADPTAAKASK